MRRQREYRRRGAYERNQKKYEKTVNGILLRRHRHAAKWWRCDRDEFRRWAKSDEIFVLLYKQWRDGGFRKTASPVVVILDTEKPPGFDNCVWVTYGMLSSLRAGRSAAPIRRRRRIP